MSASDAATRAESSDSIAASAATVRAGATRAPSVAMSMPGSRGVGIVEGSAPITSSGADTADGQHGDDHDADERPRQRRVQPRGEQHADGDDRGGAERPGDIGPVGGRERLHGRDDGVRTVLAGERDSGRGEQRHLLQEDDDRDAEGEALDHRPGDERDRAPQLEQPRDQDEDPGEDAHDHDGAGAVRGDDRHEHHDHGAGRPRHLDVGPAEDGRDDPGDDRGDETHLGREAGADAEAEGERQGDDPHGESGEEIPRPACGAPAGSRTPSGAGRARSASRGPRRAGAAADRVHAADPASGGQRAGVREQITVRLEHRHEERARDREQVRHPRIGQPVVDMARPALGLDEPVASQHREVLGQMRRLEVGLGLQLGDAHLGCGREQFEDADAERVREPLEQVRLHFVQRTLAVGEWHDEMIISSSRPRSVAV